MGGVQQRRKFTTQIQARMLRLGLKRLFGAGLGLTVVGSYCYANTAQLPPILSGANNKFRTFFTLPRGQPPTDAAAEFEAQWNLEVMGSASDEAVHGESARPDDVWLLRPEEVRQSVRQIEEQGLQQVG